MTDILLKYLVSILSVAEHKELCESPVGARNETDGGTSGMKECELKGMCKNGKCIETEDGKAKCECKTGMYVP